MSEKPNSLLNKFRMYPNVQLLYFVETTVEEKWYFARKT